LLGERITDIHKGKTRYRNDNTEIEQEVITQGGGVTSEKDFAGGGSVKKNKERWYEFKKGTKKKDRIKGKRGGEQAQKKKGRRGKRED